MPSRDEVRTAITAGDQKLQHVLDLANTYGGLATSDPGLIDETYDLRSKWERAKTRAEGLVEAWVPVGIGDAYQDLLAISRRADSLYGRANRLQSAAGQAGDAALSARVASMFSPQAAPSPSPRGAGGRVAQVQAALNNLRVPPANAPLKVDGILGRETRKALAWFQAGRGIPQTGGVDAATLSALSIGDGSVTAQAQLGWEWAPFAIGAVSVPAFVAAMHAWRNFRGKHAPTVAAVPGVPASVPAAAAVHGEIGIDVLADLSHDRASIARTQRQLNTLGERLSIDGSLGPLTQGAIARFQQGHGLTPTGRLDVVTSSIIDLAATTGATSPTVAGFGFEWVPYLMGLGTLPLLGVARSTLHAYTGGAASRMRGDPSSHHGQHQHHHHHPPQPHGDSMGFEWTAYLLGLGTIPLAGVVRNTVHQYTGGMHGASYGEDIALMPWELDSTPTQDILFGDTMMDLPADWLGRMRF